MNEQMRRIMVVMGAVMLAMIGGAIVSDHIIAKTCDYVEDRLVSQRGIMAEVKVYDCAGHEFYISGWD